MQQRSKILLAAAGVLTAVLGVYLIASRPAPSDNEMIDAQTQTLIEGAERHSVSQVMSVVSAEYHDATVSNTDQLNFFLRRVVGQAGPVDVQFFSPIVTIEGDTATSKGHLHAVSAPGGAVLTDQDVTLHWKRETGHRLLVFPTPVWRLTSAEYQAPGLSD
ncbi:hypothetical protein CCAX7_42000 [Capsulimonas corticalis]|uniref:Uncharacterized protein n=1 Tax=Capsulimonas corticalis TaxID=2219043 RepID=A0A402CXV2_9BACT|nr:hypothetical protein [Capsulimonas corticalis]BDI32149.1 hypothetical protein CCAX7_42000 [Capsulimonas corticalis]